MKRPGLIVLALVAALTMTLAVVEALLRMFPLRAIEIHRRAAARTEPNFFQHDGELGWRGLAAARGTHVGWEFTSDVRLNARGFRDADVDPAKPGGRFRVVLLGDSITWGHGVGQGERYGDRLGQALRGAGLAVDVVNLGVSGYGTDQELLLWDREGRRYCADLVLLGLYENDVRENVLAVQGRHGKPYFEPSGDGQLVLRNVPVPAPADPPPSVPPGGARAWLQRHLRVWAALAFVRETWRDIGAPAVAAPVAPPGGVELTARLVSRLAASVRRDGSAFGVVILPDLFASAAPRAAARDSGVGAVLDLGPIFHAADPGRPLFYRLDGAHWTPAAHTLAGDAIAAWIRDARRLPASPRTCGEPA